ncbi:flagellar biosynthetic protein FliO [Providencia burhodogranariea]|uniref:Flagellar protein n=1 Tax=Providencia burhodogranariea DSM 19968 TaxID=1141662 RepID=K8X161_9GAMM|nr:flagellar biosynthetic protein FliO [Providencia burhodogranariea]EKT62215.1 protein mopB [Providencia burhodogranariea DSM 19968]
MTTLTEMQTKPFIVQTEQPSGQAISAVSTSDNLMQVSGALGAIILLILMGYWLIKKLGLSPKNIGKGQLLAVKASCSLGNKERVMVIEINQEWLVLGVTAHSINLLHQCPAQNKASLTSQLEPLTFQSVLKKKQDAAYTVASQIPIYK